MNKSNYDKFPAIHVKGRGSVTKGWEDIVSVLHSKKAKSIAVECYQGVNIKEVSDAFSELGNVTLTSTFFKKEKDILEMTYPDVTDNDIFGFITRLELKDFFDQQKLQKNKETLKSNKDIINIIIGPGAFLCSPEADIKIYADMARWEIQLRMRKKQTTALGVDNSQEPFNLQYKRGFFVDWRVCDKHKKQWFFQCDFMLDTNKQNNPKMVEMDLIAKGMSQAVTQPFRLVPFFDPGPWGGHWMEEVCGIEVNGEPNHAWCFDCVPEENSMLFNISGDIVEMPSINLVFFQSRQLLGDSVEARFGQEFPIRFDLLDTMGGGNLSLQVHPDTTYIQQNFGINYTQDESYYLLDAKENACVYLGVKKGIEPSKMINELKRAQEEGSTFQAEEYVNTFAAKKHDHFLIPGKTVHCSGKDSMVLEISATPYIFTFKVWDWGRLGLDGKPRPINIKHASNVIDWERDTQFVEKELINQVEKINEGDDWVEERTGLHKREFIETRRHWFSKPVKHNTNGGVNVLNLVEGKEALIESPSGAFESFVVHYAETFIVPAQVGEYIIRPYGESEGERLGTIKAYVRVNS